MKAIVLSYDQQLGLAQLVCRSYFSLGIDTIEFLIPVNESSNDKYFSNFPSVTIVRTAPDILSTMSALLKHFDDKEWVFWCIDDRYPITMHVKVFSDVIQFIEKQPLFDISGIKLIAWRERVVEESFRLANCLFSRQEPIGMFGFWHHQFLRAKVLQDAFFNFNNKKLNSIREINQYYHSLGALAFLEDIYVPTKTIVSQAEPLVLGKLTHNGLMALKKFGCVLPKYDCVADNLAFYDYSEQLRNNPKRPKSVGREKFE